MADSGPALWEVFAVLGFLVLVLLVGYYAVTRLRLRRKQLSLELDSSKDLVEDRSFNQLKLARAEADLLASRGIDVGRARELIVEAETARGRRDYDNSLALARSAHESLVRLHQGLPITSSAGPKPTGLTGRTPPLAFPSTAPGGPLDRGPEFEGPQSTPLPGRDDPSARATLPRNKAESKFQISLLDEELTRATSTAGPNAAVLEATEIKGRATTAFDQGDFTEALRLALRGRRRLGTQLETLAPGPGAAAPAPAETGMVCISCGEALRANDRFCRSCGTLRGTARCAACGTALDAEDKFCAACGRPTGDGAAA
ncbi:MAG TPA: zinc ribbon domain-containing protein [Thermoplasmata archaeon]|nr:zinc ribbon domain-containing protein [Thermoplasmata archaeon]